MGKDAKISFTAGSGGPTITPAEGRIIGHRVFEHSEDFTQAGHDSDQNEPVGFGWALTVRCTVNNGTSGSGNPQRPRGVAGTVTIYKNGTDTSNGKWTGLCHVNTMSHSMQGGGDGMGSPQIVDYILLGTGPLTETP